MDKQLAFYFDSSVCTGCKACQMACKDKHNLEVGLLWRRVYEVSGGQWRKNGNLWQPDIFAYNVSLACNHCRKPICQKSCPTGAIFKRGDGIVFIDDKKCAGCRYCEWGCPYGSPQYDRKSGIMTKCHFCFDLVDLNLPPACVAACPMRALDFGPLSELKKRYKGDEEIYPLPNPALTEPAVLIKPHRDASRARREKGRVANREEVEG
jgi:anaerobic dimethyl sulfoxide reductase subunit B (iron-sulfur subunit)